MGFLSSKESFYHHDIIFTGIKENANGDFIIKYFPDIISNTLTILRKNNPDFNNIYSKLQLNNVYTILLSYQYSPHCMNDCFNLVDVNPPNIYRITRKIINMINIDKEFHKPLFQLVFNVPHSKRIV